MFSAYELNQIRHMSGTYGLEMWAALYGLVLRRVVTVDEVPDAHKRIRDNYYREHPAEKAVHDRAVEEFMHMERSTTVWKWED